jgi:hypothetical protein
MIGDVVRVKYNCTLVTTGQVVASTKNGMQRGWVEYVLGIGQVVVYTSYLLSSHYQVSLLTVYRR